MSNIGKRQLRSGIIAVIFAIAFYYTGNRAVDSIQSVNAPPLENIKIGLSYLFSDIANNPFYMSTNIVAIFGGGALVIMVLILWLYRFAYIGNYRIGEESGSAKWGNLKEASKFKDNKNTDNNLIFTDHLGMALSRPKFDQELDRNLNALVIGGSGMGKTRNMVKPNLLQLNGDYFITDPKGTGIKETGHLFNQEGYQIKSFNTINFNESQHYNPLAYVKTDADILSFVNCLIANTKGEKTSGDQFWENAERLLYTALIALLRDWLHPKDYTLSGLLTLLSLAEAKEDNENFKSALDLIFLQIEKGQKYKKKEVITNDDTSDAEKNRSVIKSKEANWVKTTLMRNTDGVKPGEVGGLTADEDFALDNYKAFKVAAGKTLKSIIISCNVRLKPLAIREVRELLKYDEMELDKLGDKDRKTIVFCIFSDTDDTFAFLFAMMMWQTVNILCVKALNDYGGRLPRTVMFHFDEFAQMYIPKIEKTIAVVRSRNIGIFIYLQSVSQLKSKYKEDADTIIDCCDSTIFLGGKSKSTTKEITEMIGKETINKISSSRNQGQNVSTSDNKDVIGRDLIDPAEISKMSRKKAIVLISGTDPLIDIKYRLERHPRYKYIDPGHAPPKISLFKRGEKCVYNELFDFTRYVKSKEGN